MKKLMLRFVSVFIAATMSFLLAFPVFASSDVEYVQKSNFWRWVAGADSKVSNILGWTELVAYASGKVCPVTDDYYHRSNSIYAVKEDGYYDCICSYCGTHFIAYESDFQQSYDDYVSSLETPIISDIMTGRPYKWTTNISSTSEKVKVLSEESSSFEVDVLYSSGIACSYYWYFQVSSSGEYTFHIPSFTCTCGVNHLSVWEIYRVVDGASSRLGYTSSNPISFGLVAGYTYYLKFSGTVSSSYLFKPGYHRLSFDCTPYITGGYVIQDDPTTRMASIMQTINNYNSYDYSTKYYIGTVDASNNVTNVYAPNIYDEATMVFTEPVTGTQYQTTGWKYLYSSGNRGYILSLPDDTYIYNGQTIRTIFLAYLDDALYICGYPEEGTSYTSVEQMIADEVFRDKYNYVVAASTGTDPDICSHVYTSETITAPTCTEQGVRRYTCILCGHTRDEKIPATGHTWEVTETVDSVIDDNGDVKSVGYVLYTCSSCGETYKQWNDTGQPGPSDGSGSSGSGSSSGTSFWDRILEVLTAFRDGVFSRLDSLGGGGDDIDINQDNDIVVLPDIDPDDEEDDSVSLWDLLKIGVKSGIKVLGTFWVNGISDSIDGLDGGLDGVSGLGDADISAPGQVDTSPPQTVDEIEGIEVINIWGY